MKKVPAIYQFLVLLSVLSAVQAALADTAADLKQAQGLYDSGRYAQAEALYKRIVTDNPRTEAALDAKRGLAMLYAKTGEDALLAQTCESLTTDFGGHKDMPSILGQIADECRNANRHSVAVPIYQYVVDH